jgi:cytochrome c biogenesis protein CcdA
MAETITPVVHGGRRRPYLEASALHVLGATATAALLGLALGATGALLRAPWEATPLVVGAVAALYFLREAFGLPVPLPDRKRQVPEWWRTFYSPGVAAFLYGAGLGVGFLTYLSFGTFAAVMAAAIASGDPLTGALLCGAFGLARGLAVVVVTWNGPADLDEVAGSSGPRLVNAAALAATALTAAL